jgi:exopolyphosphatase/guanosine-5'-triphosphate,3'-diphosphate pyrophosphatase
VAAAIDVGSNSVHALVAIVTEGSLVVVHDESELLGLGDVVDLHGHLPPDAQAGLIASIERLVAVADTYGAQRTTLLGTEPMRRAANGAEVAAAVERAVGRPLVVLDHREEALLTFLGVTGGVPLRRELLVLDIGGGSSEWVVAGPRAPARAGALPTGSARLAALTLSSDPPTWAAIDAARARARQHVAAVPAAMAEAAVFTGGTATNLVRLAADGELRLTRSGLAAAYRQIATSPAAQLAASAAISLRRARQMAAGAALVEAFLEQFGLDAAEVSTASLREGAIVAAERAPDRWREQLRALVGGVPAAAVAPSESSTDLPAGSVRDPLAEGPVP